MSLVTLVLIFTLGAYGVDETSGKVFSTAIPDSRATPPTSRGAEILVEVEARGNSGDAMGSGSSEANEASSTTVDTSDVANTGDDSSLPSALKPVKASRDAINNTMRWKWGAIMVGGDPNFAVAPRKRIPKILVIGVVSKASNVEKRNAIRPTWASRERTGVVIKFILGYSQTPEAPPEDID